MDDDQAPVLNQVNVIAGDWEASLAFYRLLGLEISGGGEFPPGTGSRHAAVHMTAVTVSLEFDTTQMLHFYAADSDNVRGVVLGFAYPSAAAVDAAFQRLSGAGHTVRQPPHDAFWGARYAIVEDPNGNAVGLMGPVDRSRGYAPGGAPG